MSTDTPVVTEVVAPAQAAKPETYNLRHVTVRDLPGFLILIGAIVLIGGLIGVGAWTFGQGHPVGGGLYLLGSGVVAGLYLLLLRHVLRWYRQANVREVAAYTAWQGWLRDTYGLTLPEARNDELVNYQNYTVGPSRGSVWGMTAASMGGQATTLRLVGDSETGYRLEYRGENGVWAPLTRRIP